MSTNLDNNYRLLVEAVVDYAIYTLDPGGHVSNWNSGAERIKGYRPEEIIGSHYSRFYSEADQKSGEPQKNLRQAAVAGRCESEGWRVRKDGTQFAAHVIIDRILDENGELIGFAKVTRDVTEQRKAAADLQKAREDLFQSQKLEAIGQLTGGLAHDFNNLLMAIISCMELLTRRVPDDPKIHLLIETAKQGAFRGAALTQRMLAFARRQELKPTVIDLITLVRGMAELLQRSVGAQVQIAMTFPLTLESVLVDSNQLELALMNLAVNARDAMPDGGQLSISAQQREVGPAHATGLSEGRYVELSVADEGHGMDEETRLRATEPFFTTKGVGKGTGLGLSMVHGLAEQSNGRLIVHSTEGKGSRMALWLPAAPNADDVQALPVHVVPVPVIAVAVIALRILAVDDDNLVLTTMSAQLEDLGHLVISVSSAEQALQILQQGERFDLLITDHSMPGMTGSQLAEMLRENLPEMPVVVATGYAEIVNDYKQDIPRLQKPFTQETLAIAIFNAVATARTRQKM